MYITAFFTDGFAPKTGLTPTVSVVRLSDDTIIVNGLSMTESVLAGYYYYNFSTYDPDQEYAMVADGGSSLDNVERYKFGGVIVGSGLSTEEHDYLMKIPLLGKLLALLGR